MKAETAHTQTKTTRTSQRCEGGNSTHTNKTKLQLANVVKVETAHTQTKTTPICQSCQSVNGTHTIKINSSTSQSREGENSAHANKNNSSDNRGCRLGNQTKSPRPVHGRRCQGSNSKKASFTGNVIRVATAPRLPTRQTMSKWQRQTRGPKTATSGRPQPEGRQDRKYTRTGRTP